MTQVNFRIDEHVKDEADVLFDHLGLSLSAAITIFLRQSISHRGIPFPIREVQESIDPTAYCANPVPAKRSKNVAALASLAGSWKDSRTTKEIIRDVEGRRTKGRRVDL
jgi:addiction module RelB/DinJ family antitoxin